MTDPADRPTGETPTDPGRASVARLLAEQRQHWRGGRRTPVESLLSDFKVAAADSEIILDLIYNEVILRQECGESPALADYAPRFPHLTDQLKMLFEIDCGLVAAISTPLKETVRWGRVDVGHENGLTQFQIPGFEVLQQLGRGGMGVVYKARQLALDRIVAIKVIRAGLHADAEDLRRFRTEALAAARLQHPNIAQIHDVDEYDGRPFIVLEYVAGGGLDRHLAAGPVPPTDAARLTEHLARAVQFAHERGVVHRDLKPANVLVSTAGDAPPADHGDSTWRTNVPAGSWTASASLKITDFGLAKVSDVDAARTQTGHILGTPMYMAPEQAAGRNEEVGPATDVYSLGAILYECLTGHPPFQGQSPLDTLSLVQNQEPVPPRRTQPRVPRDLENICLKCLEKEPRNRYDSAQSLADDLARFLAGKPVLARPVRFWWRGVRWLRRHPTGSTAITLGFLLLLSALIAFWQGSDKQSRIDRAVEFALREAEALRNDQRWTESLAAIRRAEELLQARYFKSPVLQTRIDDQRRDLNLVQELEKLQLELGKVAHDRHELQPRRSSRDYEIVFSQHGFNICSTDPADIGRQIRDRPDVVRMQIVSALDDWIAAMEPGDSTRRAWLERVVATADPDDPWRTRLHEARSRDDLAELKKLATDPDVVRQSVNATLTLAGLLVARGENAEAVALLRRGQQIKPGDFWINSRLASYCIGLDPPALDEALRYALVAQALRPDEAGPQFFVGYVLQRLGKTDEAIDAFARAATLDRDFITGLLYLAERYSLAMNWAMAEK
ncbi:MAG: protein kinase, partial [Gemmataceae bacterium]|nr:protein kinase [Gemmataceae bacterium]